MDISPRRKLLASVGALFAAAFSRFWVREASAQGVAPPISGITAIDLNQFIVNNGTLSIKSGPTIATTRGVDYMVVSANATREPTAVPPNTNTILHIVGADGQTSGLEFDTYGGAPVVRYRRINGTSASPTAIANNDILGQFNTGGYNGTAAAAGPVVQGRAIEAWTTLTNGSALDFQIGLQGTLAPQNALQLDGTTGGKRVRVFGGLSIDQSGTFVANGATGVTVVATGVTANSVIVPSIKTPGGTPGALPHATAINAGVDFTIAATALDTSTYNYAIIN